ncbi:ABC transporter ATP-binding protein [Carboxydothermus ferrireducens]|uniref:Oligopeptide/dipeptide ABC transporter ATP-binding protein n=1 Tax=Carboxydothermus ferrireducens DSM 11255 TaxID=1119529 RepID=A0ABX2R799_9THEO|nr:dipeptide ABC transporter ATP-binding protein [Carboxydothermus ferrireducens]NYE57032.1 oligopeptide/dipeptide ABC transporter ATP-binding protein [Carboxydothermus ferrireducens DSM 11255]
MMQPLLEVRNLKKYFPVGKGFGPFKEKRWLKAVDDVSFTLYKGETLGLVGESGCGKSTTGRAILRLIEPTSGEVIFEGENILTLTQKEMRKKRREMQIIFQDPFASLDPRMTVAEIIAEPLRIFKYKENIKKRVEELIEKVGLSRSHLDRYPHEFSGGQRQRIGIARALALNPKLIVCDEPVSALDVSVQAQVINLLEDLQKEYGLTYIFIAHDLSVVKHISQRVAVMYLGKIVESGPVDLIFNNPKHPYTIALLSAIPVPEPGAKKERIILEGDVPSPINPPAGCSFHPRCPDKKPICTEVMPEPVELENGHVVRCHLYSGEVKRGI